MNDLLTAECAFKFVQENGKLIKCQFREDGYKTRLIPVGDIHFCRFHLPFTEKDLKSYNVKLSDAPVKQKWDDGRKNELTREIKELLERSSKEIILDGVVVPTQFLLENNLHRSSRIRQAIFCDAVIFAGRHIGALIDFSGTQFRRGASFRGCNFQQAIFSGAYFLSDADFSDIKIQTEADFNKSRFTSVSFENSIISPDLKFEGATCTGECSFNFSHLKRMAKFSRSRFKGSFLFRARKKSNEAQCEEVDFSFAEFGSADFSNREFKSTLSFDGALFGNAPQFHGAEIHEDTSFPPRRHFKDATRYTPLTWMKHLFAPDIKKYAKASRAYRTLRLESETIKAHDDEAMFWELELRTKRRASINPIQIVVSYLYDLLTHYGNNYVRPIVFWLLLLAAFAVFIYPPSDRPFESRFQSRYFDFSFQQTVRPFAVWTAEGETWFSRLALDKKCVATPQSNSIPNLCAVREEHQSELTIFRLLASMQSLLSLSLIALSLFAIRRAFRLQ